MCLSKTAAAHFGSNPSGGFFFFSGVSSPRFWGKSPPRFWGKSPPDFGGKVPQILGEKSPHSSEVVSWLFRGLHFGSNPPYGGFLAGAVFPRMGLHLERPFGSSLNLLLST